MTDRHTTVGLALGSGSSKGWAHIGVLETLDAEGIPVDLLAGCSVGAFVGAIYATGRLQSLKEFVLRMDGKRVFSYLDVIFPRSGILDGSKVDELYTMHSEAQTFADLEVPLRVVATDLDSGEKVVIHSGDIVAALRASMSVPGVFPPFEHRGRWLVDGGLVDPVPVGVVRSMGADLVIAVDLSSRHARGPACEDAQQPPADPPAIAEVVDTVTEAHAGVGSALRKVLERWVHHDPPSPRLLEVVESAIDIMQERIKRVNLAVEAPEVLLQPQLGDLKMFDYDQVERAIEEGARCVRQALPEIRRLLGQVSPKA